MRKILLVGAVAVAAVVGTAGESRAGCGLLSRLFGGGCCGSSRPAVIASGPACAAPVAYPASQPVRHVVYSSPVPQQMPQYLPTTSPDACPGGNCSPRGTTSRYNPYR